MNNPQNAAHTILHNALNRSMSILQVTSVISCVSLVATCAHQLLYSFPNWRQLVMEPIAASGHSGSSVVASHAAYGLVTAVHNHVQVGLLTACCAPLTLLQLQSRASIKKPTHLGTVGD